MSRCGCATADADETASTSPSRCSRAASASTAARRGTPTTARTSWWTPRSGGQRAHAADPLRQPTRAGARARAAVGLLQHRLDRHGRRGRGRCRSPTAPTAGTPSTTSPRTRRSTTSRSPLRRRWSAFQQAGWCRAGTRGGDTVTRVAARRAGVVLPHGRDRRPGDGLGTSRRRASRITHWTRQTSRTSRPVAPGAGQDGVARTARTVPLRPAGVSLVVDWERHGDQTMITLGDTRYATSPEVLVHDGAPLVRRPGHAVDRRDVWMNEGWRPSCRAPGWPSTEPRPPASPTQWAGYDTQLRSTAGPPAFFDPRLLRPGNVYHPRGDVGGNCGRSWATTCSGSWCGSGRPSTTTGNADYEDITTWWSGAQRAGPGTSSPRGCCPRLAAGVGLRPDPAICQVLPGRIPLPRLVRLAPRDGRGDPRARWLGVPVQGVAEDALARWARCHVRDPRCVGRRPGRRAGTCAGTAPTRCRDELAASSYDAVVDVARCRRGCGPASRPGPLRTGCSCPPSTSTPTTRRPAAGPGPALREPRTEDVDLAEDPEAYGPARVACEQLVRDGAASWTVVRPGLIVGPGDPTDDSPTGRLASRDGGEALAGGQPET